MENKYIQKSPKKDWELLSSEEKSFSQQAYYYLLAVKDATSSQEELDRMSLQVSNIEDYWNKGGKDVDDSIAKSNDFVNYTMIEREALIKRQNKKEAIIEILHIVITFLSFLAIILSAIKRPIIKEVSAPTANRDKPI